jgi:4-amino-4-deoxy-L-arabinose transferase-like glycosyltransferase
VLWALLLAALLVRLALMAWLPLMDTTEARYAEIGRHMVASGDWVTPWHVDKPFWGKPVLSFWLTAGSFALFGINEFAARLPHLLCLLGVAWITWRMARERSRDEALLALALLAGMALFYVSAGAVMTDEALVLGTTLAMRGAWRGLQEGPDGGANGGAKGSTNGGRFAALELFGGLAIGLLAKGPLAAVLIVLPVGANALLTRQVGEVWRRLPWVRGTLAALLAVAPWYLAAELRTPGFLQYFIVGEHWHRFVTPGWQGDLYGTAHRVPPGSIWLYALASALPWTLLLPRALWRARRDSTAAATVQETRWRLYLLCWTLAPLVFFTAARNIIWTYALPALPALALWMAALLAWPAQLARAQRLVGAGLAISLLGTLGFALQLVHGGTLDWKSSKGIVTAWQDAAGGHEPLVFVGGRQFSASFYSRGQAQLAPDAAGALALLGPRRGYVAIAPAQAAALGPVQQRLLGRYGGLELVEVDGRAAALAAR